MSLLRCYAEGNREGSDEHTGNQLGPESHPFDVASMVRCSGSACRVTTRVLVSRFQLLFLQKLATGRRRLPHHFSRSCNSNDINGPFPSVEVTGSFQDFGLSDMPSTVSSRDYDAPALCCWLAEPIIGWLLALEAVRNGNIAIRQQTHRSRARRLRRLSRFIRSLAPTYVCRTQRRRWQRSRRRTVSA